MVNKRVKMIAVYVLVFIALIGGLHTLILNNAEKIINDEVYRQTNGRFKLSIGKIKINYRKLSIEIRDSKIEVMDSAIANQLVMIETPYLGVHLSSFVGMVIRKDLSIDSLICDMPHITLYPRKETIRKASLSFELGQILLSIRKTLDALEIEKLRIRGGIVTVNPNRAELRPIEMKDLNLGIDHIPSHSDPLHSSAFLDHNNIHFHAGRQQLVSQDQVRSFCFRSVDISTKNKWVALDSCTFRGKRDEVSYEMFFQELKLVNLDFNRLYEANTLRTDSALCKGVKLSVQVNIGSKTKSIRSTEKLTEETMKTLTQNLELKYVGLSGSEISLITINGNEIETYSSSDHSIELLDVGMNSGLASPLQIGEIRFQLFNYRGYSADSLFSVSFESMALVNKDLRLIDFKIEPTNKYKGYRRNQVSIDQLTLKNISFAAALFNKKVVTDEIIVDKPFIHVFTDEKNTGEHKPIIEVLNSFDKSFGIKKTTLHNATIVSEHLSEHRILRIDGLNTIIRPTEMLSASGIKEVIKAVDYIEASKVEWRQQEQLVKIDKIKLNHQQDLTIAKAEIRRGGNYAIVSGLNAERVQLGRENSIALRQLNWESGEINFFLDSSSFKSGGNIESHFPLIKVDSLLLRNTRLNNFQTKEFSLKGEVEYLSMKNLSFSSANDIQFEDFGTDGKNTTIQVKHSILQLQKFSIHHNRESFFKELSFSHRSNIDTTEIDVRQVNFVPDIKSSIQQKVITMKNLEIANPCLLLRISEETHTSSSSTGIPEFSVSKFNVSNLSIDAIVRNRKGNVILISDKGRLEINNLKTDKSEIKTEKIALQLSRLKLNYRDSIYINSEKNGLSFEVEHFSKGADEKLSVQLNHVMVNADDIVIEDKNGDDPIRLHKAKSEMENMLVTYPFTREGVRKMFSHPAFTIQNTSCEFVSSTHLLSVKGFSYSNATSSVGMKSLDYVPIMDRQAFTAIYRTQSDYLKIHFGEFSLSNFNLSDNVFSKKLIAGTLTIRDLDLQTYKDKRLPAGPERVKKLPTVLIQNIPFPFEIAAVYLTNAKVEYTEVSDKTGKEGIVRLNRINLKIEDIKNRNLTLKDSLSIKAEAWLMDTAKLNIVFKESYLDSLSSFVLKVQSGPFDLRLLNSFTEALASISIRSGYLHSLSMVAVGGEFISLGEMKFYYDDLDIDLQGNKEETRKNIINSFTSMVANDIIIKKENHNRTSMVYFERLRNKTIFNYWIKMTLSGIMTTVGVQQTVIYKRRYRNYLKKNKISSVS